jgi:hypothetical protein
MRTRSWRSRRKLLAVMGIGVGVLAVGLAARRTWAVGVPSVAPLSYSGVLQDAEGKGLSGEHALQIRFWNVADGSGEALCTSGEVPVTLVDGRFSLPLPEECVSRVQTDPDVWVEVILDDSVLGRSKLGAVPYALEANRASAAGGPLESRLVELEAKAAALEARGAELEARAAALDARTAELEARKVATGSARFEDGECETAEAPCLIDISAAGFQSAPSCTITPRNPDGSGYTEHLVLHTISETELRLWRGQFYQKNGTTMLVQYLCVGR